VKAAILEVQNVLALHQPLLFVDFCAFFPLVLRPCCNEYEYFNDSNLNLINKIVHPTFCSQLIQLTKRVDTESNVPKNQQRSVSTANLISILFDITAKGKFDGRNELMNNFGKSIRQEMDELNVFMTVHSYKREAVPMIYKHGVVQNTMKMDAMMQEQSAWRKLCFEDNNHMPIALSSKPLTSKQVNNSSGNSLIIELSFLDRL